MSRSRVEGVTKWNSCRRELIFPTNWPRLAKISIFMELSASNIHPRWFTLSTQGCLCISRAKLKIKQDVKILVGICRIVRKVSQHDRKIRIQGIILLGVRFFCRSLKSLVVYKNLAHNSANRTLIKLYWCLYKSWDMYKNISWESGNRTLRVTIFLYKFEILNSM